MDSAPTPTSTSTADPESVSVSVLAAGHVNWDVTLRVDSLPEPDGEAVIRDRQQSGGGSAANVAVALSELGVSVDLVGSVGDDDNGLRARRELERAGVSLQGLREVRDAETSVKYLLVDDAGDVSVLGNDGVNEAVRPDDVDADRVRAVDHVHLTSQRPETAGYIAKVASDAGVSVSFDPGRRFGDRTYDEALSHADLLFATDHEVDAALETDADESVDALGVVDRGCVLVVTSGAAGATVYAPDGQYHHAGFDVDPVDTAGAGDAFAAGFLAACLESGGVGGDGDGDGTYERALAYANACGALAASRTGARTTPEASRVRELLESRD